MKSIFQKNFINLRSIQFIPHDFILWISLSWQTLSKALGIKTYNYQKQNSDKYSSIMTKRLIDVMYN